MRQSIEGRSILLTGGGSGIGAGTAMYLVERGARVTITGRRSERIQALAESLGPNCQWVSGDVCSPQDREKMLFEAISHGAGALHGLINNAGITHHSGLLGIDAQALQQVFDTNVTAPLLLTQQAVPALEQSRGCVIFIGSVHVRLALAGRLAYAASKGAIVNASRVLAAELGPRKIRVNCIVPGAIATEINAAASGQDLEESNAFFQKLAPLHPLGRIGEPLDIAEGIEYLLLADWTTGAVLDVDGGMGLGATKL